MGRSPLELAADLRRPEHTGGRRCWPCTVANAAIVAVLAVAVARRRRLAALPVLLVGAALIDLRGYVVPGTPRFAPRLVAVLPAPYDPFDHGVPDREPPREGLAEPGADVSTDGSEGGATGSASDPRDLGDRGLGDHERGDHERS